MQAKISQKMRQRADAVLDLLKKRYPQPETHLHASTPWELLAATVLSAQCTDARVNQVTPQLFAKWPDPAAMAQASLPEVEGCIRSTGFFRNKAKHLVAAAQKLEEQYHGKVPQTLQELTTLPGVARKTANVVLWGAFGRNEGIAVDTHVLRIAYRLGLTSTRTDPKLAEQELMRLFPQEEWGNVNHRLVWFGRHVCIARKPLCSECELVPWCLRRDLPPLKEVSCNTSAHGFDR